MADLTAHGTVVSPPSRVYNIYQANPANPSFALAANAVALDGQLSYYTWNEVSRNIPQAVQAGLPPGFDYSPWMPDGEIASAGRTNPNSTVYPRTYRGLDQVSSDWPTTPMTGGQVFTVDFLATAPHNPSVWDVWMTKPGWDPNMPLTWDQMEFLGRPSPILNGNHYTFDLDVPRNRSGHHVLWVTWQRNDPVGEVFVSTSDVLIAPAPPLYPGTGEDLELASGIAGQVSGLDEKSASVGDAFTVELTTPSGTFVGAAYGVFFRPVSVGQVLLPGLNTPALYMDPAVNLSVLRATSLALNGASTTLGIPPTGAGRSFAIQGAVSSSAAANGSYASTPVHLLTVLP